MRRTYLVGLALLAVGTAILGPSIRQTTVRAAGTTVTIPGDSYSPPAVMIEAGQTVTWVNKDSDPHVTTNAVGTPVPFTLVHQAGKSLSFTFTKPGLYPYYCLDHATFNPTLRRAVARKEADTFPVAMEGLIVVKGPGFAGGPSATVKISGGAYAPYIAVLSAGGKVTWVNDDTAAHMPAFVAAGAPKLDLAAGKSASATFAKPGIYFYYDGRYATYDAKLRLAAAKKGAPHFPVSMQGYVIVL